jgi:hypothetical protein
MTERERNKGDYRGRETEKQEDREQRERESRGTETNRPKERESGKIDRHEDNAQEARR